MGFLTPLALAFAALSIPILILYMLKLRRKDVLVSSTLLWHRLLRDREANAPWQRLRRNLLLFLQLVILGLLTLALARPFIAAPAFAGGSVVILLDASASMQARDVAPTRFDAALRNAREIVATLGPGDTATLISVEPHPRVLASETSDGALLRRALQDAAPSSGSADWEAAFALAAAGLAGVGEAQGIIISDGAVPEHLPALPGEVRFIGVGGGAENLAITALATRVGPSGAQAFLRVTNFGNADAETLVEFSADGTLFDARHLAVPARAAVDVTLTDLPYDMQILQASLSLEDALSLDNTAWSVVVPPASGRVLFVSSGNLFLERALGLLPEIELTRLAPDQPLPREPYDLVVYDGVTANVPAGGNLWLIGPPAPVEGLLLDVGDLFTATQITRVAEEDPLLRYVDLDNVHVLQAREVELPPGARVLVEAQGGPLLFVVERPDRRLAVWTFNLHDSDLPLQIAFPVLTANLAGWLMPQGAARFPPTIRPGDPVSIPLDPEAAEALVTNPQGLRQPFRAGEEIPVFAATEYLGIYQVEQVAGSGELLQQTAFAVNLFDEAESDVMPREVVQVGQAEVTTVRGEEGRREFWPWLAAAALCVMAAEWWAYQRGSLLGREAQ